VSSYGRSAFTRGTPCLCLVRSPLYTSAAATCSGPPYLRRRRSDPTLDTPHLFGCLARANAGPGRDVPGRRAAFLVFSNLRRRSTAIRAFGAEGRRRHVGSSLHKKTSHNMSSISVFVGTRMAKVSPRDRSCTLAEGRQRGQTKGEASENQLPQRRPLGVFLLLMVWTRCSTSHVHNNNETSRTTTSQRCGDTSGLPVRS
jgi:hypothetical protein